MKQRAVRKNNTEETDLGIRGHGESAGSCAHRTGRDRGPSVAADFPAAGNDNAEPEKYVGNTVMLMARDPYWCYAFWDISSRSLEEKKKYLDPLWGGMKLNLRVYDVTGTGSDAGRHCDISMSDIVGNLYINIWSPASVYRAEAGLLTADGHFIALAASNRIETPPDSASEDTTVEWQATEADLHEILKMPGNESAGLNNETPGAASHTKSGGYR